MSGVVYRSGRIFDSLEELVQLTDQIWGSESQRTAFRGHANQDWQLVPSLFRTYTNDNEKNIKHFVNNRATTWQFISDLMQSNIVPTHLNLNYLQLLAVAQHYNEYPNACGTELLDFSWSPKVAASFAFQHKPTSEIGAIYLVNLKEISDLYLGVVEEIDLPDFFIRPNRQKATFFRQFNIPSVNEKGLLDIYYFHQNSQWPSNLKETYTQNYLLEALDDPVLKFSRSWHPYVDPKVDEGELQMLLQMEFYLLAGFGQDLKISTWAWLDALQEMLFHVFRGASDKAMYLKDTIDLATVKGDLLSDKKMEIVQYMLRRIETVCAIQQGHYRVAEQQIRGELSTAISTEDEIVFLNELGNMYLQEKNLEEALKTYRKAEELSQKQDVQSVYNVGIALKALGHYQEAVVQFNRVVFELDENDAESWQERANALNNLGQFHMAVDSAKRALELNSNLPYALGHQAVAYLQMGDFKQGEIVFKKMLEARPNNDWALFNLTSTLYYQGKYQEASQTLELLRRANPTYPRIDLLANMLKK